MKKKLAIVLTAVMVISTLAGCSQETPEQDNVDGNGNSVVQENEIPEILEFGMTGEETKPLEGMTNIYLSDDGMEVDGSAISTDKNQAVYAANDIVFYLADQGFTYGEGEEADEHTQEEADAHTVVHITEPGSYAVRGQLSAGQIAIDLGEDAKEDPEAVVTLYLNGVDINCEVAPAIIFYNVYECGSTEEEAAAKDVDTSAAGANVVIVDGTANKVSGSYVARIYKSYTLNEAGTEVVDNKKLHKYDAAFYSKMSMNIDGGEKNTGTLNIYAENEGLDSELHLTMNGGNIYIESGNDGINTNEDGISVTTINDGTLNIVVNGSTGEGDGIDSNGWLVINGGNICAIACGFSEDAGIDSDMGIYLNGGNVVASGNMLDQIAGNEQPYVVFMSRSSLSGSNTYTVKDADSNIVSGINTPNDFRYLLVSNAEMEDEKAYTLWSGDTQVAEGMVGMNGMGGPGMGGFGGPGMGGFGGPGMGKFGGRGQDGFGGKNGEVPALPEGMNPGEMPAPPEGMNPGEMPAPPEGMNPGEIPEGVQPPEIR